MAIICIIPARYASTRFEGKALADICGKTMIQRTYEQVKKAKLIDEIYIATDDEGIRECAESFGAKTIMTSKECKSGTDRIAEALQHIDAKDDDIIVNVQGDEPLIDPRAIDAAAKPFIEDKSLLMLTLITKIKDKKEYEDPNIVKVTKDKDDFALYFSRSCIPYSKENLRTIYKQLGIYVFKKAFLIKFAKMSPTSYEKIEKLEQLRALENCFKIKLIETDYDSPSVNTASDLEIVSRLIMRSYTDKKT